MTSIIPPSQLKDSYFGDMPDFPSITGATGSSVNPGIATRTNGSIDPTLNGYVSPAPLPNKIYYNKRVHTTNRRRVDPNTFDEVIEKTWVIPYTVDHTLPVSEITERIDTAMDKIGLYNYWKINYNDYTITAVEKLAVTILAIDKNGA